MRWHHLMATWIDIIVNQINAEILTMHVEHTAITPPPAEKYLRAANLAIKTTQSLPPMNEFWNYSDVSAKLDGNYVKVEITSNHNPTIVVTIVFHCVK